MDDCFHLISQTEMRRIVLFIFSLMFALSLQAQIIQEVIASAGGYNSSGEVLLSWTLGETVVPTFSSHDGSVIITHGFQQQLIVTAVEENINEPVSIKVFPNPVSEVLNLQFNTPVEREINIDILDFQGKLVRSDFIGPSVTNKQINLQEIPAGIYYLRLSDRKHLNVYKVVKL